MLIIVKLKRVQYDDPERQVPERDKIVILPRHEPERPAPGGEDPPARDPPGGDEPRGVRSGVCGV